MDQRRDEKDDYQCVLDGDINGNDAGVVKKIMDTTLFEDRVCDPFESQDKNCLGGGKCVKASQKL